MSSDASSQDHFEKINFPTRGVARFYGIAIDIGTKNLHISFGYALRPIPKFDINAVRNQYKNEPFAVLLGSYAINLVDKAGIQIKCEETAELKEMVKRVDLQLPKPQRQKLPDGDMHLSVAALRTAAADSINESTSNTEKLAHAVASLITSGPMRWIFLEAYPIVIEPQVDHLQQANKRADWAHVNWLMAHLLISSVSTIDRLLGWRRVTQFIAKKYGLKECVDLAKQKHPRLKDEYKIRKYASVEAFFITIQALGQSQFVKFLQSLDKADDGADSGNILFQYFKKVTRPKRTHSAQVGALVDAMNDRTFTTHEPNPRQAQVASTTTTTTTTTTTKMPPPSNTTANTKAQPKKRKFDEMTQTSSATETKCTENSEAKVAKTSQYKLPRGYVPLMNFSKAKTNKTNNPSAKPSKAVTKTDTPTSFDLLDDITFSDDEEMDLLTPHLNTMVNNNSKTKASKNNAQPSNYQLLQHAEKTSRAPKLMLQTTLD